MLLEPARRAPERRTDKADAEWGEGGWSRRQRGRRCWLQTCAHSRAMSELCDAPVSAARCPLLAAAALPPPVLRTKWNAWPPATAGP